ILWVDGHPCAEGQEKSRSPLNTFTPPHQPRCTASPHHPVASTSNHETITIEIRRFHA
ncbi:hypothetical protein BCR33DRAFT_713192, partial [Rhizoclosmatium globosum]